MAYQAMAVYLLVAIVGVFVSSTAAYTKPNRGILFENCPIGTIPGNAFLDPAVGKILLSCRKAPSPVGKCVLLDEDDPTQSNGCPPNFAFVGIDRQRPICCQFQGIHITDCRLTRHLYSTKIGFDIKVPEGYAVVGRQNYGSCRADPTVFRVIFCKLTQEMAYTNTYHMM
ncbi:uncharacterized protein LOC117315517 isoform X1 [Pecten maximus]|uniref:uncharacterized protein LOC117315517 isoform X1 n=1 Tax=Pecten maximus TaxID=6579 RepID=UPI0014588D0F|nr:uncharacterized protein LOC117315517 isoform X1 [Pecten maximus]